MKTYKEVIEKPRLEITTDYFPQSPREWSNIGDLVILDRGYDSPDKRFAKVIEQVGKEANNLSHHIELIKDIIEGEFSEEVVSIHPVNTYEHSGRTYSLGTARGFDISNNGFYIVTKTKLEEIIGKGNSLSEEDTESYIEEELETYNKYMNGGVYMFELYDAEGNHEDSCGGFYDIEEIKEHLPKEWEDEDMHKYVK